MEMIQMAQLKAHLLTQNIKDLKINIELAKGCLVNGLPRRLKESADQKNIKEWLKTYKSNQV